MNDFFVSDFHISKINLCMLVEKGTSRLVHRNRPNHGLVYEISGSKKYTFADGGSMTVRPGDIFYLPKFSDYTITVLEDGDCLAVNFELFNPKVTYEQFKITPDKSKHFHHDFKEITKLWKQGRPSDLNRCYAILYNIIYSLQQMETADYTSSKQKRIATDSAEYVVQHLGENSLTVEALAKQHDISPEYFRKIFKSVYHISPRKYIINARLDLAKRLLLSGEFHIDYISEVCGFESESYFSRTFKRMVGVNPSVFKSDEP